MAWGGVSRGAEATARWAAVGLGFAIPVSAALDGVLAAVMLVAWLLAARYRERLAAVRAHPVALLATGLFALYLAGSAYSGGSSEDVLDALGKAARLLFIPLLITLLQDPAVRRRAWWGFMAAMLLTLGLSYLLWLGLLPGPGLIKGDAANPVIFKLHITQNLFMAFTAFACAVQARHAPTPLRRGVWAALALLAAANVLFLVQGRTGHLVLLVLLVYLLAAWFRWRGLAIALAAMGVVAGAAYLAPATALHQRAVLAYQQFSDWEPEAAASDESSIGLRLEFYHNTLQMVRRHPLLGAGTGGFEQAYAQQVRDSGRIATRNPHNEYLMVAVQLGLTGLALLLALFAVQWRLAARLPAVRERTLARGLVLAVMAASAVSSTLMDHAEGWFYVWMSGLLFAGIAPGPTSRTLNPG